jgi:hypothetical protein
MIFIELTDSSGYMALFQVQHIARITVNDSRKVVVFTVDGMGRQVRESEEEVKKILMAACQGANDAG